MKRIKYFYISLLFPILLYGQSEYVNNSSFGVKADYIFTVNDELSGRGGDIGVTILNRFDIGFEYVKTEYEPGNMLESTGTAFYAAYNFRTEISSLKISAGYTNSSMKIINFDRELFDISGPFVGVTISPKIYENESLLIMPSLGFTIAFLDVENDMSQLSTAERDDIINIGLELNIVPKVSDQFYFILAPAISKSISSSEADLLAGFRIGAVYHLPK